MLLRQVPSHSPRTVERTLYASAPFSKQKRAAKETGPFRGKFLYSLAGRWKSWDEVVDHASTLRLPNRHTHLPRRGTIAFAACLCSQGSAAYCPCQIFFPSPCSTRLAWGRTGRARKGKPLKCESLNQNFHQIVSGTLLHHSPGLRRRGCVLLTLARNPRETMPKYVSS